MSCKKCKDCKCKEVPDKLGIPEWIERDADWFVEFHPQERYDGTQNGYNIVGDNVGVTTDTLTGASEFIYPEPSMEEIKDRLDYIQELVDQILDYHQRP